MLFTLDLNVGMCGVSRTLARWGVPSESLGSLRQRGGREGRERDEKRREREEREKTEKRREREREKKGERRNDRKKEIGKK